MRLGAAVANASAIKVPFANDEVLNVTYRPTSATPADLERMAAEAEEAEEERKAKGKSKNAIDLTQINQMVSSMCDLIVSWDLTEDEPDDDGEYALIPITPEALRNVPTHVFMAIMKEVQKDQAVDPEARAASDAG